MSNKEPATEFLRWGDVVAWQPVMTRWVMNQMIDAKIVKPVRVRRAGKGNGKGSRGSIFIYNKNEIKSALGIT